MAFFLARVSGSSFLPAASRLVGRRGRGHVGQLLRGSGQQIRCRDAHDGGHGANWFELNKLLSIEK